MKLFLSLLITAVLLLPIVQAQLTELTYDQNGNLISGDGKFRVYNGFNQLVEIRNGSDSSASLLEEYWWDPVAERIAIKYEYEAGSVKEKVYYNDENFVTIVNSSGTFNFTYIKQDGVLVAQKRATGDKDFIHADPFGSQQIVTNEVGTVQENTSFDPFGRIISGGNLTRFDYEGKEYSSIVGDYDFNFRKYNPDIKIFSQPDTVVPNGFNPQDLNRYSFEKNNPYKINDPTGHVGRATIDDESSTITVETTVYIWGFGASKKLAKQLQDSMKKGFPSRAITWGNKQYSVNFKIGVVYSKREPKNLGPYENAIKIRSILGYFQKSGVDDNTRQTGAVSIYSRGVSASLAQVFAHEVGHLLGLDERYHYNKKGQGVADDEYQYSLMGGTAPDLQQIDLVNMLRQSLFEHTLGLTYDPKSGLYFNSDATRTTHLLFKEDKQEAN